MEFKILCLLVVLRTVPSVTSSNITGSDAVCNGHCCTNYRMVNGNCELCPDGTFGKDCNVICPPDYFGKLCLQECNCTQGLTCDAAKGCVCLETNCMELAQQIHVYERPRGNRGPSKLSSNGRSSQSHTVLIIIGCAMTSAALAVVLVYKKGCSKRVDDKGSRSRDGVSSTQFCQATNNEDTNLYEEIRSSRMVDLVAKRTKDAPTKRTSDSSIVNVYNHLSHDLRKSRSVTDLLLSKPWSVSSTELSKAGALKHQPRACKTLPTRYCRATDAKKLTTINI